jgi:hypothetical protein
MLDGRNDMTSDTTNHMTNGGSQITFDQPLVSHVLRVSVALFIGAVATVASTLLPMLLLDRGSGCRSTTVFRGTDGWFVARDEVFGLRWVNLQHMSLQLLSPVEVGALPPWAEPPTDPHRTHELLRVATLATGWPQPAYRFRWVIEGHRQNFPMPAELDDQDTSIIYAVEDVFRGTRGGGPTEQGVLWPGALANLAAFVGAAYAFLVAYALVVSRGRRFNMR